MAQKPVDQGFAWAWWGEGHCSIDQYYKSLPEAKQMNNTFGYQGTSCVHSNIASSGMDSVCRLLVSLAPSTPASRWCLVRSPQV